MEKSKQRLLVNAEAFGYGPTAAIASFFPYLRERFKRIGFIGQGHTLDLQRNLPYDQWHDISVNPRRLEPQTLEEVAPDYDIFLTAMDFSMAENAKRAGLSTIIYDAITWYWEKVPKKIRRSDLYLAQNFFGVEERLKKDSDSFPKKSYVVPPIVPSVEGRKKGEHVLINLGGLEHPFWETQEAAHYAAMLIQCLLKVIPKEEKLVIATSVSTTRKLMQILSEEIADDALFNRFSRAAQGSLTRSEVMDILSKSKYAYMTSGLGNIYDAARFDLPTVWLPPSNDSQGQQLDLIKAHAMADASVDWADLKLAMKINYQGKQKQVIKKIRYALGQANLTSLTTALDEQTQIVSNKDTSNTRQLIDRFGSNGEEQVAQHVYQFAQSL